MIKYLAILSLSQGMTGFPWIDAVMRQLRTEGWIHHVAQQAVGCFLTRGCLWISWEEGFKVIIIDNNYYVHKLENHYMYCIFRIILGGLPGTGTYFTVNSLNYLNSTFAKGNKGNHHC